MLTLLLALQAAVGQTSTVSVESSIDMDILVRDGLGENRRVLSLTRKEKFSQEVTELADGKAKSVKVKVLASTLQRSGTDMPIEVKPTPLSGQVFASTRTGEGWTARDSTGGAPPIEAMHLGAWNEAYRLMPKDAPTAGANWQVDGRDFLSVFYPMGLAEAVGKLDCSCEAVEGGRATILFKGQIQGRAKDESVTKLMVDIKAGRLIIDVAKAAPVSLSVSGSIESGLDQVEVYRKPAAAGVVEEERRKVGEISVKSAKLEVTITFE
ncbi:MAG TPA: hypothetical protein VF950_05420 [Planctomycetota bacterium]